MNAILSIYNTPLDFLYLALSLCILLLTLFLVMALYQAIGIMRNVRKLSATARDTVKLVNHYLWQPLKILMLVVEKFQGYTGKKK